MASPGPRSASRVGPGMAYVDVAVFHLRENVEETGGDPLHLQRLASHRANRSVLRFRARDTVFGRLGLLAQLRVNLHFLSDRAVLSHKALHRR
jgi:hypothetical protein